ncbi:MAG: dTDP-4-dehydrorhamnose 3,5-epimerase [Kaiparowitsia implicata GSE-PSE-MK54-09C]|nr:dTDP-4-dehydrorhamnose 3,5-epimerase [Kaiparowitsia implicata GSE-PSE-MK54-09C]
MNARSLELDGLLVLEPQFFADERGGFFESYNARKFADLSGHNVQFVQDNHSQSRAGVLRGLHHQLAPGEQGKLVRAIRGAIFDVAVDIRHGSETFGRWAGILLSAENRKQLWIPPGFAHGFLALSDCEVLYKADAYYAPALERSIRWDDPSIGVDWPLLGPPILSPKDAAAGSLHQARGTLSSALVTP